MLLLICRMMSRLQRQLMLMSAVRQLLCCRQSDATVSALKSQLEILRIQFDSAKGSDEIEALHLKISKVMADLEVAKQSAVLLLKLQNSEDFSVYVNVKRFI